MFFPLAGHIASEVMNMSYPKYSGLAALLKHEEEALRLFESLPLEVRDRIAPKGDKIDSVETLRHYVDALSDEA